MADDRGRALVDEPVEVVPADARWPDGSERNTKGCARTYPTALRSSTSALRDYLRAHREARRAYADAKWAALHAGHRTLLDYSDAKAPTVQDLVARPCEHQRQHGGRGSDP